MKRFFFALLFFACPSVATAQQHFVDLTEFKFNGISGQFRDDTTTVFSLVCNKWQGKTFAADSLISKWLAAHPDASYRPVCSFSYYTHGKRRTFTYGWIVSTGDKDKNLNIYLVKHHALPAGTLLWAAGWKDLKPHSDVYNDDGVELKTFIDNNTYRAFTHDLKKAQTP